MLSNLRLTPFKKTNARSTDVGLRIAWDSDTSGEEVFISWQRDLGPFNPSPGLIAPPFELAPAEPGAYVFQILSHAPGRIVHDYGFHPYTFDGLPPAEQPLPRPSGLELVGVDGALLGSARTFAGRDLRIRWNSLRTDALQTDRAGDRAADQLIEQAVVRVYDDVNRLLRREILPVNTTEWVYTYAHATEDLPLGGSPDTVVRDLRIEVEFFDSAGRVGTAALLNVEWTLRLTDTPDLYDDAVTTPKLVDDAVTTPKLVDDAVTTPKIIDAAVETVKIEAAGTKEFASFTKSSSFTLLDTDGETETYGPATQTVFDVNSVVEVFVRINFDLLCAFPFDADSDTKNQVFFYVLRRDTGSPSSEVAIDTLPYDMHVTYPASGFTRGRISIPTFSVEDTPGPGEFEYRIKVELNIAQGGASSVPILEFQAVLLNLRAVQTKR